MKFAYLSVDFATPPGETLDRAAREAVLASQVTPFRRAGVNEDTQFLLKAPINFVLE